MKKILMPQKAYPELSRVARSEGRTPEVILEKALVLYEWYQSQEGNGSGDAGVVYYADKCSRDGIKSSATFERGDRKSREGYRLATNQFGDPRPEIYREPRK